MRRPYRSGQSVGRDGCELTELCYTECCPVHPALLPTLLTNHGRRRARGQHLLLWRYVIVLNSLDLLHLELESSGDEDEPVRPSEHVRRALEMRETRDVRL